MDLFPQVKSAEHMAKLKGQMNQKFDIFFNFNSVLVKYV